MGNFSERFLCRCAKPHKQETHVLFLGKSFRLPPLKDMQRTNIKLFPPDCHSCSCANLTLLIAHPLSESRRLCAKTAPSVRFLSRRLVCPREIRTEDAANECSCPCLCNFPIRTITSLSKEMRGNYTTFAPEQTSRLIRVLRGGARECDSEMLCAYDRRRRKS